MTDDKTPKHKVYVTSVGGAVVLSCETLEFKNVEMPFEKLTPATVTKTITDYRPFLKGEDIDVEVIDMRPKKEEHPEDTKNRRQRPPSTQLI